MSCLASPNPHDAWQSSSAPQAPNTQRLAALAAVAACSGPRVSHLLWAGAKCLLQMTMQVRRVLILCQLCVAMHQPSVCVCRGRPAQVRYDTGTMRPTTVSPRLCNRTPPPPLAQKAPGHGDRPH